MQRVEEFAEETGVFGLNLMRRRVPRAEKVFWIGLVFALASLTIRDLQGIIKTFVEDIPISQVLEQMIQEKLHIAIVSSKEGRNIGMITLEDIIEEMVGEIEDEFDRLPNHVHPYGGGWIMGGGVLMKTVAQTTGLSTLNEAESILKLADWCAKRIKEPLVGGEIIDSDGLHVIVRKLRRKKVGEAIVSVQVSS